MYYHLNLNFVTKKNMTNKDRLTQSICCYGCQVTPKTITTFFKMAEEILQNNNFYFDVLYALKKNSYKSKKLKYSYQKLENLSKDIGLYDSISAKKNWETGWETDYYIYLSVRKSHTILTFAENEFTLSIENMCEIILLFSEVLKSPYSIGFSLPYNKSPIFYTCGIGYGNNSISKLGSPEQEASDRFARWGGIGMSEKVYLRGVIREVYPVNLLCKAQVNFLFNNGKPFIECVKAGLIKGTIKEISSERFLWIVSETDITYNTKICEESGFLFNQLRDVPGDILWDDPDVAEYHKGDAQREANRKIIQKYVDAANNNNEIPDTSELLKIFE